MSAGARVLETESPVSRENFAVIRKLAKPTYLDFSSPLTVSLLRKNLMPQHFDLVLAEALPSSAETLARVAENEHVSELTIEIAIQPKEGDSCM